MSLKKASKNHCKKEAKINFTYFAYKSDCINLHMRGLHATNLKPLDFNNIFSNLNYLAQNCFYGKMRALYYCSLKEKFQFGK